MEREAAADIQLTLGLPARRAARNGVPGAADIVGTPGIRFEVKGRRSIGALRFLDQARAEVQSGDVPVVLMRENGGPWALLLELSDLERFVQRICQARALPVVRLK